jgi:heptosyltransferase-2
VAIFGPTVPGMGFAPFGKKHSTIGIALYCRPCGAHGGKKCPERHFRCMKDIQVMDVQRQLERYLDLQE